MTAYVHSIESFGTVDGPGIRFVLFLQGCPMRCKYCHNPDTWGGAQGSQMTAQEVAKEVLKYKNYFGQKGGITVSGGEPLLQIDFLIELFTLLKAKNINTCIDTSGICFSEEDGRYEKLLPLTDLFLLDIKHSDEEGHKLLTGRSGVAPKQFARYLSERGKKMWIRHVLVPQMTDYDEQLINLAAFLSELNTVEKIEVLPYHSMGEVKYQNLGLAYPLQGTQPPTKERVENAKNILYSAIKEKNV